MKVIKMAAIMITTITILFTFCTDEDALFEVIVVDPDSEPVRGAWVEGGFDWTWYKVYTDSNGVALVPGHARGEHATIMQDNYLPLSVERLDKREYVLEPTPQLLRSIGTAEGTALIFGADNLVTLDYQGDYHVYLYDNQSVTEIASAMLPGTMKQFKIFGDTLWYTTHNEGIYVYSIANALQPQLLFHLNISGYLDAFAVKDSIVVVCSPYSPGPLRVFSYTTSGQFQQIGSMSEFIADEMTVRDNYLILVGGEASMPTVFDLTDPTQPLLVYNGLEPGAETGLILDTMLVVIPESHSHISNVDLTYKLIRLTNPLNPYFTGTFPANAVLYDIINNEYAVGDYVAYYSIAVLAGTITDRFSTVALINEVGLTEYGGSRPPYFLINDQLMILEPR